MVAELPAGALGSTGPAWALDATPIRADGAAGDDETADEPRTSAFPWLGLAETDGEALGAKEAVGAETTPDDGNEAGDDPTATPEPADEAVRAGALELAAELVGELVEL